MAAGAVPLGIDGVAAVLPHFQKGELVPVAVTAAERSPLLPDIPTVTDFGQSRLVCEAHWQSDIDAGRVIAAATVARLHADQAFMADLEAARAEVASARQAGAAPTRDCAAEAASLAAN